MNMQSISLLLLCTLASFAFAHKHEHVCNHDANAKVPEVLEVDEDFSILEEERMLAGATSPQIRIYTDFSNLLVGDNDFKNYVQNQLVPPVINLLQNALKVKYPLTSPLQVTTSTICGYNTPKILSAGVATDLFLIITSQNSTNSGWVASATSCMVSTGVKRPIIATIALNTYAIYPCTPDDYPLSHEFNIYSLLHEMVHALGFSSALYSNFVDASGNPLTGHVKSVLINGYNRTVLDVAPLTSRLRNFYGCKTLEGGIMENDGGWGTAGSHWERAYYAWEFMASGALVGMRMSEFTLALLEGSGWYIPDYTYAEPFYHGQGQGCNYIYQNANLANPQYDDYCNDYDRGCTPVGTGGGYCGTAYGSDSRKFVFPATQTNCENPSGVYYTPFSYSQVYKRGGGSKCFSGNLTTYGSVYQTTYCFTYSCINKGLNTVLQVNFGSTPLNCTKEGPLTVAGYLGQINCPDPLTYCNTIGKAYCPRNCMGRGKCVNNQCVCNTGFTGIDCSFKS